MSDLHDLPLRGHDIEFRPYIRARVYRFLPGLWMWQYTAPTIHGAVGHGPYGTWAEAYASALRMLETC